MRISSRPKKSTHTLTSAGFFLLRLPLLPADYAKSTLAQDVDATCAEQWLADELFSAALWVSNRRFFQQAVQNANSGIGLSTNDIDTLVAYRSRMSLRCTPFGLNATCSLGEVGAQTNFQDINECDVTSISRPSSDVLGQILRKVAEDPTTLRRVVWRLNPTLFQVRNQVRFVRIELKGDARSYVQKEAELDAPLKAVVNGFTDRWYTFDEIVSQLEESLGSDAEGVADYVEALAREQILVTMLEPPATSTDPLSWMIEALPSVPSQTLTLERLRALQSSLKQLDTSKIEGWRRRGDLAHEAMTHCLDAVGEVRKDGASLLQTDAYRELECCQLGAAVVDRIGEAVLHAHRCLFREYAGLTEFADRFQRKFEDAEVPLLLALDDDYGVPLDVVRGQDVDLLDGINLVSRTMKPHDIVVDGRVLDLYARGLRDGATDALLPDVISSAEGVADSSLPRSVFVLASILARDLQAVRDGEYEVYIDSFGAGGADMFGRFCREGSPMFTRVSDFIAETEMDNATDVWAEVAHIPQDTVGNVVYRPALRPIELNCLGTTSRSARKTIELKDLTISLRSGKFVLRHTKTRQIVHPRITNAHNFARGDNMPLYKLMGYLQHQEGTISAFSWGGLTSVAEVFPRVRWKNVIFSRRAWRFAPDMLTKLAIARESEFREQLDAYAQRTHLPGCFLAGAGDQKMLCDRNSPSSLRGLQKLLRKYGAACVLEEVPELNGGLWLGNTRSPYFGQFLLPFKTLALNT